MNPCVLGATLKPYQVFCFCSGGGTDVRVIGLPVSSILGEGHCKSFNRMQSLDEPWTEEEGDGPDHPYYNSVPSKMPPPGGFLDARLKARPQAPDTAQVSLGLSSWVTDDLHLYLHSSVLFLAGVPLSFWHGPSQAFFHQYHRAHGKEGVWFDLTVH